jgi:hypothetical protein
VAGHLRVPTAPFSHRHLPQQCFWPDLVRVSPVDCLVFYFLVLALFPVIFCFYLFSLFFGFGFSLFCFVCILFLQFCRSPPRQFRCPPPTAVLYSTPLPSPPRQTSNAHFNGRGLLEHDRFFPVFPFCLYLFFPCIFVVIMLLPHWFGLIPFGPNLCVVDVYVTLAFWSSRKISPDFCVVDEYVT